MERKRRLQEKPNIKSVRFLKKNEKKSLREKKQIRLISYYLELLGKEDEKGKRQEYLTNPRQLIYSKIK